MIFCTLILIFFYTFLLNAVFYNIDVNDKFLKNILRMKVLIIFEPILFTKNIFI